MNLLFHTLLFCFFYLTCFIPNFIRLKIKCAAGYNFAFRYFRTSYLPRIIPRFTDAPLILAKDLSMAGNVQEKQLRWYNIALMSFNYRLGFGNVCITTPTRGGGCFFMGVYLCVFIHTLCANCWSVRLDLQRWRGGVSTWIKHTMGTDWLTSPRGPTG